MIPHAPPRVTRAHGDAGVSLIEMLVALVILTTAILALVTGIGTSIRASDAQRKTVTSDSVVRSWVEALQLAPYVVCATASEVSYQPAALGIPVPAKFTPTMASVDYWDGNATAGYVPTCTPLTDKGIERITMAVRSTDNRGVARIQILKGRS